MNIADTDGLPASSTYTYQWYRVDADGTSNEEEISGVTVATYTLTDDDIGKRIKVKLSFTDHLNGKETRTSAATAVVAPVNTTPVFSQANALVSNVQQSSGNSGKYWSAGRCAGSCPGVPDGRQHGWLHPGVD